MGMATSYILFVGQYSRSFITGRRLIFGASYRLVVQVGGSGQLGMRVVVRYDFRVFAVRV